MENEEVIRQQMEETRTSLTDKLETLENKVAGTVEEATCAVSETVAVIKDTVQDTVATVKDSVHDTVSSVKETMHDGVETVKDWFDLSAHFQEHPCLMFGGSVALGFLLERLLCEKPAAALTSTMAAAAEPAPQFMGRRPHHNGGHNGGHHGREKRRAESPSLVQGLLQQFGPEMTKLKSLAVGTLLGTVREMITQAVPAHTGQQLKGIIDSATEKLGGECIPDTDLATWQRTESPVRRIS